MIGTEAAPILAHDYRALLSQYGTQKAAAAAIGISKSAFSDRIRFTNMQESLGGKKVSRDIEGISAAIASLESMQAAQNAAAMEMMTRLYSQQRELVAASRALAPSADEEIWSPPNYRNDSILFFSDTHAPYHHPDTLEYLGRLQDEYGFERAICVGDSSDEYSSSDYKKDPAMPGREDEAAANRAFHVGLHNLFPELALIDGNHGRRITDRAARLGLPVSAVQSERGYLFGTVGEDGVTRFPGGIGGRWRWHTGMEVTLSTGEPLLVLHGDRLEKDAEDVWKLVTSYKKSVVKGHHHSRFSSRVAVNAAGQTRFGIETGCLIDRTSKAFSYAKAEPVIGCSGALEGEPVLFRMPLRPDGRWTGRLPYEIKKRLH